MVSQHSLKHYLHSQQININGHQKHYSVLRNKRVPKFGIISSNCPMGLNFAFCGNITTVNVTVLFVAATLTIRVKSKIVDTFQIHDRGTEEVALLKTEMSNLLRFIQTSVSQQSKRISLTWNMKLSHYVSLIFFLSDYEISNCY